MRASVRVVLSIFVVVIAITVWSARTRIAEDPKESISPNKVIADNGEGASANWNASLNRQSPSPARTKDEEPLVPTSGEVQAVTPSSTVAENVEQYAANEAGAAPHKRLLPQITNTADEGVEPTTEADRDGLSSLSRLGCEFQGGYNNGFIWDGRLQSGTASWQGGPIVYESIDVEGGTAQMIGSPGATGSLEGHADTQVAARPGRVEFLSSLKNGHVVFTTVYGDLDEQGRHIAVMSRHEGKNNAFAHYGSQFLGWCK